MGRIHPIFVLAMLAASAGPACAGALRPGLAGTGGRSPITCVSASLRGSTACLEAVPIEAAPPPPPVPAAAPAVDAHPWARHAMRMGLPPVLEATTLSRAGEDCYRRPVRLAPGARAAWFAMRAAARADGIELQAISGFRSRAEQARLVQRKLDRGIPLERALTINAAPGFSEHHGGNALDIGTPGSPAAEEVFERTRAFRWLVAHASEFGFAMSYPRDNPYGITYEPWHWNWRAGGADPRAVTYEGAKP